MGLKGESLVCQQHSLPSIPRALPRPVGTPYTGSSIQPTNEQEHLAAPGSAQAWAWSARSPRLSIGWPIRQQATGPRFGHPPRRTAGRAWKVPASLCPGGIFPVCPAGLLFLSLSSRDWCAELLGCFQAACVYFSGAHRIERAPSDLQRQDAGGLRGHGGFQVKGLRKAV